MTSTGPISRIHRLYVAMISQSIWFIESVFFYPKLRRNYLRIINSEMESRGEGVVIFDIGGNRGQSVSFFKKLLPSSSIYSFEPQESTYKKLLFLISQRSYLNIHPFNVGVSSTEGHLKFFESILDETSSFKKPDSSSTYLKKKNRILLTRDVDSPPPKLVKVTTIEAICLELGIDQIDILKVDVEGHELEVLVGANELLKGHKINILQIERHLDDMRVDNTEFINALLSQHGDSKISEIKHPFGDFFEDLYAPVSSADDRKKISAE